MATFQGLLAEHGLQTQEDILRQRTGRAIQQVSAGLAQQQYRTPADRTAGRLGGLLGAALGARFAGMTKDQREQQQIIEDAKAEFDRYRTTTQRAGTVIGEVDGRPIRSEQNKEEFTFAGDDPEELLNTPGGMFAFEQELAKAALKRGRPDLAAGIMQRAEAKALALASKRAAQAKAAGDPVDVQRMQAIDEMIPEVEQRQINERARAAAAQAQIMGAMADNFVELVEEAGGDISAAAGALGTSGDIARATRNTTQALNGVLRFLGGFTGVRGEDGQQVVGSGKGLGGLVNSEFGQRLRGMVALPPQIANDAEKAEEFQSMVIRMGYMNSKALDPRAIVTDRDLENSVRSLGAQSGNPRTILAILRQQLGESTALVERDIDSIEGRAESLPSLRGMFPRGLATKMVTGFSPDDLLGPQKRIDELLGQNVEILGDMDAAFQQREAAAAQQRAVRERQQSVFGTAAPRAAPTVPQVPVPPPPTIGTPTQGSGAKSVDDMSVDELLNILEN
jgi:hypothetical protein